MQEPGWTDGKIRGEHPNILLKNALTPFQPRKKTYSKKCALPNCRGRAPAQRVFKFPSNIRVSHLWRKACGFSRDVDITNKRICQKHFRKEAMHGKYLPKTTIPTLNLPSTSTIGDMEIHANEDDDDDPYPTDQLLNDAKLEIFDDVGPAEVEIYKSYKPTVKVMIRTKIHCTTCDIHIGTAPINEAIIKMHPLLRVTLCKKCFTFYNTGGFETGEDGSELYCRWCGQGGELYCCSNCPYVFCHNCIVLNFPKKMVTEIQNVEEWKCFVCNPSCLMKLRADHWALLNFIEKQKIDILNELTDEIEINNRMSKDISKCCNDRVKQMVIKRKLDNTADIPMPVSKRIANETNMSTELVEQDDGLNKPLEPVVVLDEPEPTPSTSMAAPPRPVSTPPRPVATVRPTGASENKQPPPKILNNLLAKKAEAKNQKQTLLSNSLPTQSIGPSTIQLMPTSAPITSLAPPPALTLTSSNNTQNMAIPRQTNPVYHTVNGFCIDLNSAAQQDMYRLPNGKIIQVRRQPASGQLPQQPPIVQSQGQQLPQLQIMQPRIQNPTFIGSYQQLQSMGANIVQQMVPPQTQVNVVSKIPPLALRQVPGNMSVEASHGQLGLQISNTIQVYQHMNTKIKTFTNCSAFKSVNTLTDVKDLTMHLTYLLNYSIGRLQSIRNECSNNMKIIESELSKQNKLDDDECEIVETHVAPVIDLDSDDETADSSLNSSANTSLLQNTNVPQLVGLSSEAMQLSQPRQIMQNNPPLPHFSIKNKIILPLKRPKTLTGGQQNTIVKHSQLADKPGSSDLIIRKIKTEPNTYVSKTGANLLKLLK